MTKLYLTEDQIVDDLLTRMGDVDRATWKSIKRQDLIVAHHGTGRIIRNTYSLWDAKNPHTNMHDGDHPMHPDNLSFRIMERVWEKVHGIVQEEKPD